MDKLSEDRKWVFQTTNVYVFMSGTENSSKKSSSEKGLVDRQLHQEVFWRFLVADNSKETFLEPLTFYLIKA